MEKNTGGGRRIDHSGCLRTFEIVSLRRSAIGIAGAATAAAGAGRGCGFVSSGCGGGPGGGAPASGNGTSMVGSRSRSRVTTVMSSRTGSVFAGFSPRITARSAAARSLPRW